MKQIKSIAANAHRILGITLLTAALFVSACEFKSSDLVKWSERGSRYAARGANIVQGYVNDGSLPNGGELVRRLNTISTDAASLANAFRNGATNTVELAANLTTAFDAILSNHINVISDPVKRTLVMVALTVVDEVLHDIAANMASQAAALRHHAVLGRYVQQAEKTAAAEVLRKFAKKPRLRCRDAASGRFLKMEKCKASPETTVIERVVPKTKTTD